MGSLSASGDKSSTGDVGGDGVGGLRDEDDFTFFEGGSGFGCCGSVLAAAVAQEEITGAKMRWSVVVPAAWSPRT